MANPAVAAPHLDGVNKTPRNNPGDFNGGSGSGRPGMQRGSNNSRSNGSESLPKEAEVAAPLAVAGGVGMTAAANSGADDQGDYQDGELDEQNNPLDVGENPQTPQNQPGSSGQSIANMAKASGGDPRNLVAQLADEHLHLGARLGTLLWMLWGLLSIAIVGAIPFNILLFSPKSVYRLSEIILDFVGIGEELHAADKMGLDKINITLADWQKAIIILYDIILLMIILVLLSSLAISLCYSFGAGGVTGAVVSKVADVATQSGGMFSAFNSFCQQQIGH
jgi:hypothetical protein